MFSWERFFKEIDEVDKEVAEEVRLFVDEVPSARRERVRILARHRGEIRNRRIRIRVREDELGGMHALMFVGPDYYGISSF